MEKAQKVHATKQNNDERRTPRASSHNTLACRVNELLSSGAGDAAWRIFYYAHSMFRQPRLPQGVGLLTQLGVWPSGDEWWNFYAHFEPPSFKRDIAKRGISWPQTLAGYPEGANVINPMCKFAFGHKIYKGFWWGAIGLWAEGNNFNPRLVGTSPGVYRNSHFWRQAQTQRGAIYFSYKTDKQIKDNISKCIDLGIPRSAANRVCERRTNVSTSVNAAGQRPLNQILSQGILYQLYAPAVVKGYKIWKRGVPDEHMSDYYSTPQAAKASSWGQQAVTKDSYFSNVEIVSPVLHRKYATHQVLQSIFHYLMTFRGSEHQRALFCREIPPRTFEVAAFEPSTPADYITQNYPFLKKVSTTGPLTVCDVGFDFQDFLSRQFVLAPAYGTGVERTRRNMKYGYYGGETTGTGGTVTTLAIDREGYPLVKGRFGEATPIYGVDLPINLVDEDITYPNHSTTGIEASNGKQAIRLTRIRAPLLGLTNQPVAYFRTNPSNKDKNAFCMAGYYIHFTGVQHTGLNCKIVIRKGATGKKADVKGDVVDIIYIDKKTSYQAKTNFCKECAADEAEENTYTYRIYNKLNYYKKGLKGAFSFWLEPAAGYDKIDFGKYNEDELKHFGSGNVKDAKIKVRIEMAHLLDMRPSILDAYAFLRISTTKGGAGGDFDELPGDVDNVGHDYLEARAISDNYAKFGSSVNPHGAQVVPKLENFLSNSPIYESTRKFVTSNMKMVSRKNIVNYAEEGGNGVLYFDRFAMGMANKGIDMFRGMGPSVDSVGWFDRYGEGKRSGHVTFVPIMKDKVYYVWSHNKDNPGDDYVVYNGTKYKHKKPFRGVEKDGVVVDFLETKPSGVGAYEMEGIRKKIPKGFETNEWIMFVTFNPYHWANTNIWKPSIFGDQTCFLHNRCLFQAPDIEGNWKAGGGGSTARTKEASMMRDVFYNFNTRTHLGLGDMSTYVQAPPKFNTWKGYNAPKGAANLSSSETFGWTKSCQLVTNIYRVTSVERFGNKGITDPRTNLIRVELDRGLENGHNPNFSVGSGPFNGSYMGHEKMENQKFRSDRNGLVEYIISGRGGNGYQCGTKSYNRRNGVMIGDYGARLDVDKDVGSMAGGYSIYGSCHPRFYFLKLIPEVSEGAQLRIDPYAQMEYYIRAMHGGYVDTKNEIQFASLLPGTDIFQSNVMQTTVDHDIDSLTSAINNNPDVNIETVDPNDIEASTTN